MKRAVPIVLLFLAGCADPLHDPDVVQFRRQVPDQFKSGFDQYVLNNCHGCHGLNGDGKGPLGAHRYSIPDFRNSAEFRNGAQLSDIEESIEFGVANGKTGMQAYQNIPQSRRRAIAEYIHSLRKK